MKEIALKQAIAALTEMLHGLRQIGIADNHEQAAAGWSRFLNGSQKVYNKLCAGAKGHPESFSWMQRQLDIRKTDQGLAYVHQARHAEEHGLEEGATEQPTRPFYMDVGEVEYHGRKFPVTLMPRGSYLGPITNRGVTYYPPALEDGPELGRTPLLWLAERTAEQIGEMVNAAGGLPLH